MCLLDLLPGKGWCDEVCVDCSDCLISSRRETEGLVKIFLKIAAL